MCALDIEIFTSYYRMLWKDTNCETQNWNCNSKENYEDYEINREKI